MNKLYDKLKQSLTQRDQWEKRVRLWYVLAMTGLRRQKKADWQSDMFFPLIDQGLRRFLPFYWKQVFAEGRVVNFVAPKPELSALAESAADFFDWDIKQNYPLDETCSFQRHVLMAIWSMLIYGRGILKLSFDMGGGCIRQEPVSLLSLVVPRCGRLDEADYFCHVQHVTRAQFERDERYEHSFTEQIVGPPEDREREPERFSREGFSHLNDPEMIVLWECYVKEAGGWRVETFSPQQPERAVRKSFRLPYQWNGKAFLPFISFTLEETDRSWYAPRGLAELLAPLQQYLCRTWNDHLDRQTFLAQPLFTAPNGAVVNLNNLPMVPGSFIPGEVSAIQMPPETVDFGREMQIGLATAQELLQAPTSEITPTLESKKSVPTATQINLHQALAGAQVDLRGEMFRWGLMELYRKRWAMLCSYRREEVQYFAGEELRTLPQETFDALFQIEVAGSTDSWNKRWKAESTLMLYQMLLGQPNVRSDVAQRDLVATIDARKIKTWLVPPEQGAAGEVEDEAKELAVLEMGMNPAFVMPLPSEDHATRLRVIFSRQAQLTQSGLPLPPGAAQAVQAHVQAHLAFLQKTNPQEHAQFMAALAEVNQAAGPSSSPAGPNQPTNQQIPT